MVWVENATERRHFDDLHVVGSVLLREILENRMERHGMESSDSGKGKVLRICEICNKTKGIFGRAYCK